MDHSPISTRGRPHFLGSLLPIGPLACYALVAILISAYMGVASGMSPCYLPRILGDHGFGLWFSTTMLVVEGGLAVLMGIAVVCQTILFLHSTRMAAIAVGVSVAAGLPLWAAWHYVDSATPDRSWPWHDPLVSYGCFVMYTVLPAVVLAGIIRSTKRSTRERLKHLGAE